MKATRTVALLFAAILLLGGNHILAQESESPLQATEALCQSMFKEKHSISSTTLEQLKEYPQEDFTLSDDFYSVTLKGADLPELPSRYTEYDLNVVRLTDEKDLEPFDYAIGEGTPKYLLQIGSEDSLEAPMTITLLDSSFCPYSTLHVYRYLGDQLYEPVEKNITVTQEGNVTFTVKQEGTYLVTAREIAKRINDVLTQEYPVRTDPDLLLSYLNEDSRYDFSDLITRRTPQ